MSYWQCFMKHESRYAMGEIQSRVLLHESHKFICDWLKTNYFQTKSKVQKEAEIKGRKYKNDDKYYWFNWSPHCRYQFRCGRSTFEIAELKWVIFMNYERWIQIYNSAFNKGYLWNKAPNHIFSATSGHFLLIRFFSHRYYAHNR